MIETLIENRIAELTPPYRNFFEGDFISVTCETFGQVHAFDNRQLEILESAISLYLLFLLDEQATISFISRNCDLSQGDATTLFIAIKSSLPEGLAQLVDSQYAQSQIPSSAKLATEIAETERELENLQGIRTMAGDMRHAQSQGAPTYKSTQSDLIRPSTPPPPPNSGPRWETDK